MASISGTVKVSPGELTSAAELANRRIGLYRKALDEISTMLRDSQSFWDSPGGEAYRNTFRDQYQSVVSGLEELEKYPDELLRMAGIYKPAVSNAEKAVDDINSFTMV